MCSMRNVRMFKSDYDHKASEYTFIHSCRNLSLCLEIIDIDISTQFSYNNVQYYNSTILLACHLQALKLQKNKVYTQHVLVLQDFTVGCVPDFFLASTTCRFYTSIFVQIKQTRSCCYLCTEPKLRHWFSTWGLVLGTCLWTEWWSSCVSQVAFMCYFRRIP